MALTHIALGQVFARRLDRLSQSVELQDHPRVAVLMALRGSDPFLRQTLLKLAAQDYPCYEVVITVDHESDPAFDVCSQVMAELSDHPIRVQVLQSPSGQCSLKCSCLIQGLESLDSSIQVVAFADADVVPHQTWLRELVAPLAEPSVGVTTGNQWFVPKKNQFGSAVRSVWNAGAIVPTILLGHPWAGSCAMRRQEVIDSGLLDQWRRSIVDDGPVAEAMQKLNLSVRFVPSLMMLNQEACELKFCWSYIRRMLTWSRLFESTYFLTVLHAFILQGTVLVGIGLAVYWCILANGWLAGLAIGGLFMFWLGNAIGYVLIGRGVQRHSHDERVDWEEIGWRHYLPILPAIPLTHFIYWVSAIRACFVRTIEWRKVVYRVKSGGQVEMVEYRPYRTHDLQNSQHSL